MTVSIIVKGNYFLHVGGNKKAFVKVIETKNASMEKMSKLLKIDEFDYSEFQKLDGQDASIGCLMDEVGQFKRGNRGFKMQYVQNNSDYSVYAFGDFVIGKLFTDNEGQTEITGFATEQELLETMNSIGFKIY